MAFLFLGGILITGVLALYGRQLYRGKELTLILFLTLLLGVRFAADPYQSLPLETSVQAELQISLLEKQVRSTQFKAQIEWISGVDQQKLKGAQVLWKPDSCVFDTLKPGQVLILFAEISPLPPEALEGAFSYRMYLERQGYKAIIEARSVPFLLGTKPPSTLERWRNQLNHSIESWRWPYPEQALIKAMLLGNKSELSKAQKDAYARAGLSHVLAVSGFHLGIIYLLLNYLSWFLKGFKKARVLRVLFIVLALWLYALLSGMSPSVIRATTMFSILSLSNLSRRRVDGIRILIYSALLLLWISPQLLSELGFQLSYAALAGILLLMPSVQAWSTGWPNYLKWPFELLMVSIAAQLFTAPLSLYYFHYFPLYFWLSNLVITPLVSVGMYLGVLSLALSNAVALPPFISDFLYLIFKAQSMWVEFVAQLSFSRIGPFYFNRPQVFASLLFVLLTGLYIRYRKKGYGYASLIVLFGLVLFSFGSKSDLNGRWWGDKVFVLTYKGQHFAWRPQSYWSKWDEEGFQQYLANHGVYQWTYLKKNEPQWDSKFCYIADSLVFPDGKTLRLPAAYGEQFKTD